MVCQICESYHDSVEELNAHYESDHPTGSGGIQAKEEGRFPCEFCGKSFTRKDYVFSHQRKVHGRESEGKRAKKSPYQGKFPCKVCGKKFSSHRYMLKHQNTQHK